MLPIKSKSPVVQYLLTALLVILGLMVLKALVAWTAEVFLHPIPILGGWLKSLEIVEFINVVVFAVLGFSLGAATMYFPPRLPLWKKSLVLAIAIPLVFFSSYWVRQTLWLNQISASSELNFGQANQIANRALKSASGSDGFWGYFRYTTQMPILPTTLEGLQRLTDDQKWFRSELTRFSGVQPGIFSLIFNGAGWGIRLFLMLVSVLTAVIYFIKGLAWADAMRLRRLAAGPS
ncbi:hypothetical protein [Pseudanabaena sp. FACHB-2040]|uniref:hypothetical protein n=1 Tax=Pseudanabaena sp. FACHB-2040 TaxID=2692859 RepID=UPI001682A0F0|nr:hypothetical protein [Pseudanabaena sp. FACHB-2040]MBD2259798.1 hypothetical protein [Pseudanabaena sp. FACHB-2040]